MGELKKMKRIMGMPFRSKAMAKRVAKAVHKYGSEGVISELDKVDLEFQKFKRDVQKSGGSTKVPALKRKRQKAKAIKKVKESVKYGRSKDGKSRVPYQKLNKAVYKRAKY